MEAEAAAAASQAAVVAEHGDKARKRR